MRCSPPTPPSSGPRTEDTPEVTPKNLKRGLSRPPASPPRPPRRLTRGGASPPHVRPLPLGSPAGAGRPGRPRAGDRQTWGAHASSPATPSSPPPRGGDDSRSPRRARVGVTEAQPWRASSGPQEQDASTLGARSTFPTPAPPSAPQASDTWAQKVSRRLLRGVGWGCRRRAKPSTSETASPRPGPREALGGASHPACTLLAGPPDHGPFTCPRTRLAPRPEVGGR